MARIKSFNMHTQGASHIKDNKVCQDFSGSYPIGDSSAMKYSVIAVSDGHGGDKYFRSHIGAERAVKMAIACLPACMFSPEFADAFLGELSSDRKKEEMITNLEESIIARWNDVIHTHLEENAFTEQELIPIDEKHRERMLDTSSDYRYKAYGATLIVGVVCEGFWFGFQIGDGTFVVKQNGKYKQPIELDPKCVGVNVTSICDSNAIKYFHHAWGYGVPDAIFIASDGVDESFSSVEGLYKFYDNIIKNSVEDWQGNVKELEEYLPELSEKGSRDDVSLAAIINIYSVTLPESVPEKSLSDETIEKLEPLREKTDVFDEPSELAEGILNALEDTSALSE